MTPLSPLSLSSLSPIHSVLSFLPYIFLSVASFLNSTLLPFSLSLFSSLSYLPPLCSSILSSLFCFIFLSLSLSIYLSLARLFLNLFLILLIFSFFSFSLSSILIHSLLSKWHKQGAKFILKKRRKINRSLCQSFLAIEGQGRNIYRPTNHNSRRLHCRNGKNGQKALAAAAKAVCKSWTNDEKQTKTIHGKSMV